MEWELELDFLSNNEQNLIRHCLETTQLRPTNTTVRELGRYGKSGARLLLCLLRRGMPLIVKIHRTEKIKKEYTALKKVVNFFSDVELPADPRFHGGQGALLYWHHGARSKLQIRDSRELRDIVYDFRDTVDSQVVDILQKLRGCCESAREVAKK